VVTPLALDLFTVAFVVIVLACVSAFWVGVFWGEHIVPQESTGGGREPVPLALRTEVLDRDGWRCVYCGSDKELQIDHIIPQSRGGATTLDNLECLCGTCNREKGAK
jgi:5-methylcytosine-specific restriction endonuclease McrA